MYAQDAKRRERVSETVAVATTGAEPVDLASLCPLPSDLDAAETPVAIRESVEGCRREVEVLHRAAATAVSDGYGHRLVPT